MCTFRHYNPEELGPPDASSSSFAYSYESTFDGPDSPERHLVEKIPDQNGQGVVNFERHSTHLQKVSFFYTWMLWYTVEFCKFC